MSKIAFIDLEASGLGSMSWPAEVGWCFEGGKPEAHLIAPAPEWSEEAWSKEAEALHGLSIDKLKKSGKPIRDICKKLNAALGEAQVYSDAPDWDSYWLYRLFSSGGVRQQFTLKYFGDLLGGVSKEEIKAIMNRASEIAPHTHRAREDVLHMKAIFELAAKAAAQN